MQSSEKNREERMKEKKVTVSLLPCLCVRRRKKKEPFAGVALYYC